MMAKLQRAAAMAVFALGATTASAVDNVWNGGYGGFNAGQASSHSCTTWAPTGSSAESTTLAGLYQPDCATHGAFVGGGQIGDNYQTDRLAWGVEAAVDVGKAAAPPSPPNSIRARRRPAVRPRARILSRGDGVLMSWVSSPHALATRETSGSPT